MHPTHTLAELPDAERRGPSPRTDTIPGPPGSSRPQRRTIDVAPTRAGVAFAIAAAVGVGALVWAVIAGPTATSVDTSTQPGGSYDRVEVNRAAALRDLATRASGSYDRAEVNRAAALRDLATRASGSYDRVEVNRAAALRDLATPPTDR